MVSQTSRLGIRPALPTVQTQGAHPQRSRQTTQLHSASNAGSVPERWLARVLLVRPFAALVWQAVHCHLVRSHSAFAIVADGVDRTSFHGFLAKRLLLRGGRLLKHIGLAAVVAAREISGCGFPAQVAVNALVIAVKLSGRVFRVFIRNVGHTFSFVSCRRKFDQSTFRDTGLLSTCE